MFSCDVKGDFANQTLYFTVPAEYIPYLSEREDAFLIALLPYIMARSKENSGIECICEAPISLRLFYQLIYHFVPCMVRNVEFYDKFHLTCTTANNSEHTGNVAIGTGVSGGVDSFYTLLQARNEFTDSYKITHGLCWEAANRCDTELGKAEFQSAERICNYFGIQPILMTSNIIPDFYECGHEAVVTFINTAFVFALSKLFQTYYISSSQTYENTNIDGAAMEEADLFCAYCFSTESTTFYITGATLERCEKTEYLTKDKFVMKNLYTCRNPVLRNGKNCNCSRCSKDTRTMLDLEIIGKLADCPSYSYAQFKKNPLYYWGYLYYQPKTSLYRQGTMKQAKKKGFKIPFLAKIAGILKIIKNKGHRVNPYKYSFRP